jgi:hypothetical protein
VVHTDHRERIRPEIVHDAADQRIEVDVRR